MSLETKYLKTIGRHISVNEAYFLRVLFNQDMLHLLYYLPISNSLNPISPQSQLKAQVLIENDSRHLLRFLFSLSLSDGSPSF